MDEKLELQREMEQLAKEYMDEGMQKIEKKFNHAALLIENALHLSKAAGNMKIYARNLNLMGVICAASGNEVMAIDYYLEGLEYVIDYEFNDIILIFYNNIGSRYQELGEYEKAVSYYLKVEQELKSEAAKKQDKYESWCLGTYINLASAYLALEKYILSEEYIEKAKEWLAKEANCAYRLYFKCTEWRLNWAMGRKDEVKEDVNAILSEVMQDSYSTDYVESIQLICELMQKMKEFEKWKLVIVTFENLNSTIIPEVTVSQGYASFLPKSNTTREEMLELADEALYIVKERGKNGYFILENNGWMVSFLFVDLLRQTLY